MPCLRNSDPRDAELWYSARQADARLRRANWVRLRFCTMPIVLALASWLCQSAAHASASEHDPTIVGENVASEIARNSIARVVVVFRASRLREHDNVAYERELEGLREDLIEAMPWLHVRRTFKLVPAIVAEVDATALGLLANDRRIAGIDLDVGGTGHLLESRALAGVSNTLAAGIRGRGVRVAIVDSGIDTNHPDFSGRLVAEACFCSGGQGAAGCCPDGTETQFGPGAAEDDHGHGTNVAGIAVGGGAVGLSGAAPDALISAVKVLDQNNSFCCISDVIAAFDWIRANQTDVDIVNASLGSNQLFASTCNTASALMMALAMSVDGLVSNGSMVFASSGNQGSATAIAAPACIENTVAVGAVWDAAGPAISFLGCMEPARVPDLPTCFANSNPTVDLFAPGAFLTASGVGGGVSTFGGTSQASPLAAGCAASIRGIAEPLSPSAIRDLLLASPASVTDPKNGLVFKRLNCSDAAARAGIFANGFGG